MIKQLKNRYNDPNINKRFIVGVDRSKMRLYDVDQEQSEELVNDDGPVFDKSTNGQRIASERFSKLRI